MSKGDFKDNNGLLAQSLKRSSKEIRQDRAEILYEDLEREYSREIEDLDRSIKRSESTQNRQFDFSPANSYSLTIGDDFDPTAVLDKDMKAMVEIRDMKIKRNLVATRYNELFGETFEILEVV